MDDIRYNATPKFNLGDLVIVNGNSKTWRIVGYESITDILYSDTSLTVVYDLIDVVGAEYMTSCETEVLLVCTAEHSSEYIAMLNDDGIPPKLVTISPYESEEKEDSTMTKEMTRKEKLELIDELLDRYNQIIRFAEIDGEVSEEYQQQLDSILEELEEIEI